MDKLTPYRKKRDFSATPEPRGDVSATGERRRFVVQRHRARALHYDLRFEIDGVLASWAVPKGPTLDPNVRRLAVQVEDHPMEYLAFEGVIPGGQYGGGDVIVWDQGTWEPVEDDPAEAVADGELHADVYGEKLRGRFVLVRSKQDWLLLHKHDEHAVEGWDPEDHPRSVRSGRTNQEVKADPTRAWRSDKPAAEAEENIGRDVQRPDTSGLDGLGKKGTWEIFGRLLEVTNLDKVLYPGRQGEEPVTKRDLLRYAALVAPTILPYLVVDNPAALVSAANAGSLEWPAQVSRTDEPDLPAYVTFDLDPGKRWTWDQVLESARLHRTAYERLGIRAYPKVSGSRGIEIWVPVRRGPSYDDTWVWAEHLAETIGLLRPDLVRPRANSKTLVAPYSPRPRPGAPVSVPIGWHELDDPDLRPDRWTIRTVLDRLDDVGDLFRGVLVDDQVLPNFR